MTEHKTDKAGSGHLPEPTSVTPPTGAPGKLPAGAPAEGKERVDIVVPDEVQGAWQAWRVTAVLQLLLSVATVTVYWLAPGAFMSDIGAREAFPTFTPEQFDVLVKSTLVLAVVAAAIICVIFVAIAGQMRKGGLWARFVLSAGSVYLIILAVTLFFSPGTSAVLDAPTWLQFVTGALQIASAAAAGAGLVLASTKAAAKYFEQMNSDKKWGPGERPNQ